MLNVMNCLISIVIIQCADCQILGLVHLPVSLINFTIPFESKPIYMNKLYVTDLKIVKKIFISAENISKGGNVSKI